ncbi:MAG: ATP-binding protein [Salinibacterium sp.]|nr:ATP-binding protein [Salinibacterium sp.]
MSKYSEEAMELALTQLSEHAASGKARSNWMSAFLVATRMRRASYPNNTSGTDSGVADLFTLIPDNPRGRINPFIDLSSKMRWLVTANSGRKTVWNTGTRDGTQNGLFTNSHWENGLRADAIDVLLAQLGSDEPLPARDALAVLVTRDQDWSSEPSRDDLLAAAADFLGLPVSDLERITEDRALGASLLGTPEWSPAALEAWQFGPPAPAVATGGSSYTLPYEAVSIETVGELPTEFTKFLDHHGISAGSTDEIVDLLAATLSSQLVIMAGPSGSGKSLMASALAAFFAPKTRRTRLEATRLLARREEFFGYFSHLAGSQFMAYDQLLELLDISKSEEVTPPIITIEEANLSPIEGYLSPLVHGLGGLEAEVLTLALHSQPDEVPSQVPDRVVPAKLSIEPYPRFFLTINVDADSPAPARKVVSRACVVLLETPSIETTLASSDTLVQPSIEDADGEAKGVIGRPTVAFDRYIASGSDVLQQSFMARAELLRDALGGDVISPRAFQKSLVYMAWFVELSGIDEPAPDQAAVLAATDNAVLHFVLPGLAAAHFSLALAALGGADPKGVLASRISRLANATTGQHFGLPPDFWGALS